ncbi:MAG: hypothetical protein ACK5GN_01295 [Pseudomonadota bacterium]|jgi:hypothetical protein
MNFRDANQDTTEQKYISKRVLINGQFVTLYSANGQTWLSSPEDIPALMDRLDNARVTLNTAEKVAEGESPKVAGAEATEKKAEAPAPERTLATKYRMKGPKPRPILRQDGVVIKGTPIEPISASNTVMSFSSDVAQPDDRKKGGAAAKSAKSAKNKPVKLIAPVAEKKPAKGLSRGSSSKAAAGKAAASKVAASKVAAKSGAKASKSPLINSMASPVASKIKQVVAAKSSAKAAQTETKTAAGKGSSHKPVVKSEVKANGKAAGKVAAARASVAKRPKAANTPAKAAPKVSRKAAPKAKRLKR